MKKVSVKNLSEKEINKLLHKAAFSQFVSSLKDEKQNPNSLMNGKDEWRCCGETFQVLKNLHRHISHNHMDEIETFYSAIQKDFFKKLSGGEDIVTHQSSGVVEQSQHSYLSSDFSGINCLCNSKAFTVLLFYHYINIADYVRQIKEWQVTLCENLKLKGKIRIASEGINGTVEGCVCAINIYKAKVLESKTFSGMSDKDFKTSPGTGHSFDVLTVTICSELCTLGISPSQLQFSEGGRYLNPEEFHQALENLQSQKDTSEIKALPILLDCRNFYESKIGYFEGAVKPDLRKFSYFPEYVDKNRRMFEGRKVLTYCTGGIRCERATAYLKKATNCAEVFQLQGGIHKYMERYPNGFYKGKLFVFDNRYSIGHQDSEVISQCLFCSNNHSDYDLCSTPNCRQLVLICPACRGKGKTTCCSVCDNNARSNTNSKQCACTKVRERVPRENLAANF